MFGFCVFTGVKLWKNHNHFCIFFGKINIDDKHWRDKIVVELGRDLTLRVARIQKIQNNRMVVLMRIFS